jgi:ribonuclease-3
MTTSFESYIQLLLADNTPISKKDLVLYQTAFTDESYDHDNNYDFLRGIGEMTLQQAIVQYIVRTYPEIFTPEKKAIMTDMKKFMVQGDIIVDYFKETSPYPYIRSEQPKVKLLEVFQAFLGATERIHSYQPDVGYRKCYEIVSRIFKERLRINPFDSFEILVDSKTILKQMIDNKVPQLGFIRYDIQEKTIKDPITNEDHKEFEVLVLRNGKQISSGTSTEKVKAEKKAAYDAIQYLKRQGVYYNLPRTLHQLHEDIQDEFLFRRTFIKLLKP